MAVLSMKTPSSTPDAPRRLPQPAWARRLGEVLAQASTGDTGGRTRALAAALLEDARRENASDIHLDPVAEGCEVRCRIDGALVDTLLLPPAPGLHLLRFFKTHADLDPAFALRPQDGRAALPVEGGEVSVRVATGPGVRGEKLALRLLPHALTRPPLDQLGLSAPDYETLTHALHDVRGMILVSGPTGSGKTTTLYALARELARAGRSIMTIEDPVEYVLDDVTQLQVNERQGLTYSEGVKGLLRLDPDALVLGEMRDAGDAGSSSLAPSAGAAAATADAPQIELSAAMTPASGSRIFSPPCSTRSRFSRTPSRMIPSSSSRFAEKPMPTCCPSGTSIKPRQINPSSSAVESGPMWLQHRQPAQAKRQHREQHRHPDSGAEMAIGRVHGGTRNRPRPIREIPLRDAP